MDGKLSSSENNEIMQTKATLPAGPERTEELICACAGVERAMKGREIGERLGNNGGRCGKNGKEKNANI